MHMGKNNSKFAYRVVSCKLVFHSRVSAHCIVPMNKTSSMLRVIKKGTVNSIMPLYLYNYYVISVVSMIQPHTVFQLSPLPLSPQQKRCEKKIHQGHQHNPLMSWRVGGCTEEMLCCDGPNFVFSLSHIVALHKAEDRDPVQSPLC